MAICAVIDLDTNQLINTIIAEVTDLPPNNTKLIEIPTGYYWNEDTKEVTKFIYNELDGN